MTFNPDTYWPAQGPYIAGPGAASPEHVRAEELLREIIPTLGPIESVVDLGCGRGRLAALLLDVLPAASYTGVDIGEAQVAATSKVRPEGDFYVSRLQDFDPDRQWDLVLCSEVLMHVPPADIQAVCDKLKKLAKRWVLTVDWTVPVPPPIAPWNWLYDYRDLFGSVEREIPTDRQTIFIIRP